MYSNKLIEGGYTVTKEELEKLNEWIVELSENEKKDREKYLMKLANGEFQGPPIGYSSIDKPWLKYYDENKYPTDFPKEIFYEGLYRRNKDYLNNTAINYFLTNISYKKLFANVDSLIKSLTSKIPI